MTGGADGAAPDAVAGRVSPCNVPFVTEDFSDDGAMETPASHGKTSGGSNSGAGSVGMPRLEAHATNTVERQT